MFSNGVESPWIDAKNAKADAEGVKTVKLSGKSVRRIHSLAYPLHGSIPNIFFEHDQGTQKIYDMGYKPTYYVNETREILEYQSIVGIYGRISTSISI